MKLHIDENGKLRSCESTSEIVVNKKILKVFIGVIVIIALCVLFNIPWNSLGWNNKFDLQEIGYNSDIRRTEYTITNKTNYEYYVSAVVKCENFPNKWTYEKYIATVGPHETEKFSIYFDDLIKTKPNDNELSFPTQTIKYLIYEKT
ncbi:MAG: hypothetical protein RSD78_04235 [Oscillospiraceae bacterium]